MMSEKIDYKKHLPTQFNPSAKNPSIVEIPAFNYLMIDGRGDPNVSTEYKEAVSALFTLAYALKFQVKKTTGIDYGVMPLEGLWWVEDMSTFTTQEKSRWLWTMMILQPEWVNIESFEKMREITLQKKKAAALSKIRFEQYYEGTVVQLMHIGPFSEEGPNIARMHAFAAENGYHLAGKHHEIYLSDYTRAAHEKLKTILRQPIQK